MLNDILRVFRRSVAAFQKELGSNEPEDQVANLLAAMRKEIVTARALLPELESNLAAARAALAGERGLLEQCERRATLAERIGDSETVHVAREFAVRHRQHVAILEQKTGAAESELVLRRREYEEMKQRYQEADANRFVLIAQIRRTSFRETMRSAHSTDHGPHADWIRMEERVEREVSYVDALSEISETPPPPKPESDPDEVETRLRDLKRKMGRDG